MDLSTTKTITRRRFQVYAKEGKELTQCFINNVNFFENRNLSNVRFRLASFYMNNGSIPTFLPKYLKGTYPESYVKDLSPTDTVITFTTQTATTCDYLMNIYNPATNQNVMIPIDFTEAYSKYPQKKPQVRPNSSYAQYTNEYFYVFDFSIFCELLTAQLNDACSSYAPGFVNACEFIATSDGLALYLNKSFDNYGWILQFNQNLLDLFAFKNIPSPNSSNLYSIIFNKEVVQHNGFDAYAVYSQYMSDKLNAFDSLVFKTNIPVNKLKVYDNFSLTARGYENILLIFKIQNIPYNYFNSEFTPDENWTTLYNNNVGDNMYINCYLRLRETEDFVPYTIKAGEQFFIETEEIDIIN